MPASLMDLAMTMPEALPSAGPIARKFQQRTAVLSRGAEGKKSRRFAQVLQAPEHTAARFQPSKLLFDVSGKSMMGTRATVATAMR